MEQRGMTEACPQAVDAFQNTGAGQEPAEAAVLARQIDQQDAEKDRQQSLAWYTRQRQKNAQGDEEIAEDVAKEDQEDFQHGMAVDGPARFGIDEVIRRQARQGESDGG
jgi:recombinational DNA repair ATPase RecF